MYANNTAQVIENCADTATQEPLVVMLATGNDDGGKRATPAFTAATCAAAMDKRTIVFMVGDGAHCNVPSDWVRGCYLFERGAERLLGGEAPTISIA